MNSMATYYRSEELFKNADVALLTKLWGTSKSGQIYNHFEEYHWNDGYQTGLIDVINLMSVIQCDPSLNKREASLMQRIADCNGKFTQSKKRGSDWRYDSVESNMLNELYFDAYKKGGLEDQSFQFYNFSFNEIKRIYGLPYKSLKDKMKKADELLQGIPDPPKEYEYKLYYCSQDPHSSYKKYGIILPEKYANYNRVYSKPGEIYKKFGTRVGKVHYATLFKPNYWQIYVYDYRRSHKMLQNVLHELLKN